MCVCVPVCCVWCIYVCMYVHVVCICVCVYTCGCLCMNVYVCVYKNVCVSPCAWNEHVYVHSSVKVQTHTCPDVCVVVRGQPLDVIDTAGQLTVGFCGFLALPPVSWRGAHWDY